MLLLIAFIMVSVLGVALWYADRCKDDVRYGCNWYNADMCNGGYKCLNCKSNEA